MLADSVDSELALSNRVSDSSRQFPSRIRLAKLYPTWSSLQTLVEVDGVGHDVGKLQGEVDGVVAGGGEVIVSDRIIGFGSVTQGDEYEQ